VRVTRRSRLCPIETCRRTLKMSAHRGEPEVVATSSERRE
jgi:hypothetical protein